MRLDLTGSREESEYLHSQAPDSVFNLDKCTTGVTPQTSSYGNKTSLPQQEKSPLYLGRRCSSTAPLARKLRRPRSSARNYLADQVEYYPRWLCDSAGGTPALATFASALPTPFCGSVAASGWPREILLSSRHLFAVPSLDVSDLLHIMQCHENMTDRSTATRTRSEEVNHIVFFRYAKFRHRWPPVFRPVDVQPFPPPCSVKE